MTRRKRVLLAATLLSLVVGFFVVRSLPARVEARRNPVTPHAPYPISDRARTLHATLTIGDWHADSLLWSRDLTQRGTRGHVDFPRLREADVALQVVTTVTKSPAGQNYEANAADARDNGHRRLQRRSDVLGRRSTCPTASAPSRSRPARGFDNLIQTDFDRSRLV